MRRMLASGWLGLLAAGCAHDSGAETADEAAAETDAEASSGAFGETGASSDRTDGQPPVERIEIPLVPRTQVVLGGVPQAEGEEIWVSQTARLIADDAYPATVEYVLPDWMYGPCGDVALAAPLGELEVEGDAVTAQLTGEGISLTINGAGDARVVSRSRALVGENNCSLPTNAEVPLQIALSVRVEPLGSARVETPCPGELPQIATSAGPKRFGFPSWFSVRLLDGDGEPFDADNAELDAQASVELLGLFDAQHASPGSLSEWLPPSRPGAVEIVPVVGDPLLVEVVDASSIVAADVSFQVPGVAAGSWPLEDGGTYSAWGRSGRRVVPTIDSLMTAAGPLCSAPDSAWFEVSSESPQICEVVPFQSFVFGSTDSDGLFLLDADSVGRALRPLEDGTCTLTLRADGFLAEAGLPIEFAATLQNVDGMIE